MAITRAIQPKVPTFLVDRVSKNDSQAIDVPLQTACKRNEIFLPFSVAAPARFPIQTLTPLFQSPYKGSADWREPLEYVFFKKSKILK